MKTFKLLLILLIISVLSTVLTPKAFAAVPQILQVNPSIINVTLSPGKVTHYELKITNLTKAPMPLSITFESFTEENEHGGYIFKKETNTLASWISMPQKDLLLAPNEQQSIPLTITIPKRVDLGGYSTVIFLNPLMNFGNQHTKVSAKIGVLTLANVGVPDSPINKILISQLDFHKLFNNQNLAFTLSVKNNSLYNRTVKPKIVLTSIFGVNTEHEYEEKFVFPGKTRTWDYQFTAPNRFGIYNAHAIVSIGNGKTTMASKWIIVAPWKLLFLIFFGLLVACVIIFKRRNLKLFITTLSKG